MRYAGRVFDEKELRSLVDASLDFWLTEGRYVDEFQADFANYIGTEYAILTNSGSSANLLALTALTSPLLGVSYYYVSKKASRWRQNGFFQNFFWSMYRSDYDAQIEL